MVNVELAKERGLSEQTIAEIRGRHIERDQIEQEMASRQPDDVIGLRRLFKRWRANEYALQVLWGFRKNKHLHRDFNLPHCTCPKMDNEDALGTPYRWVTERCVYHGR